MSVSSQLYSGNATVGVVIPLYNSQATIDETLASITGQTYRNLDIVVVDDGSKDEGPRIVEQWSARDHRVRLIRQANAGVAAARNVGAAAASGEYLAFCDADDLWAPQKTELQLNALAAAPERSEFAYCWFAIINADSRVTSIDHRPAAEGRVFAHLLQRSFIGNGSSFLLTRRLFDSIGGFDPSLRARNAQGCEDYLFCLNAAERTEFTLVKQFLVGYRQLEGSMSGDAARMRKSHSYVVQKFETEYPDQVRDIQAGLCDQALWMAARELRHRRYRIAASLLRELDPATKRRGATWLIRSSIKGLFVPPELVRAVRKFTRPTFDEFAAAGGNAALGETPTPRNS